MNENKIDYRFLARIVIEATTPLAVHSGDKEVETDAVIIRDVNGLPYIPGSSIAGVIRHAWKDAGNDDDILFGFQKNPKEVKGNEAAGMGSRIIFSEARILNSKGLVVDGLMPKEIDDDPLLKNYTNLPIRQHVRITHKGVAADKGKFDEQVVFAGTRFCFEMEMTGSTQEEETFAKLISILNHSSFRLGGSSRKGFGKVLVIEVMYCSLGIKDKEYLKKSSNLENDKQWYIDHSADLTKADAAIRPMEKLCYDLRPDDFFLFGSGFGDDDADMTPVKEQKVVWKGNAGELTDYEYLIPASSIKGALAHRVAYHYNLIDEFYADGKSQEELEAHTGKNNKAVRLLFGYVDDENGKDKQRGNVIISDMFIKAQDKVLNHVAIDRFTGGAIDGALFSEKAAYWHGGENEYPLRLEVLIDEPALKKADKKANKENPIAENALLALNKALDDLCKGLLSLGGGINRGNGIFNGKKV